MSQSSLPPPDLCLVGRRYANKAACIGDLAARAAVALQLDRNELVEVLTQREALGSTGIGGGIALPHARLASVSKPFVVFACLKEAIAFDAVDNRPINLACMLLLPKVSTSDHLALLSCWARTLRDKTKVDAIRGARSDEALRQLLESVL